jgi:hypothetical protein
MRILCMAASTDHRAQSTRICSGSISQPLTPPPPGTVYIASSTMLTEYQHAPSLLGDVGFAWAARDAAASQESYTHITGDPPLRICDLAKLWPTPAGPGIPCARQDDRDSPCSVLRLRQAAFAAAHPAVRPHPEALRAYY